MVEVGTTPSSFTGMYREIKVYGKSIQFRNDVERIEISDSKSKNYSSIHRDIVHRDSTNHLKKNKQLKKHTVIKQS